MPNIHVLDPQTANLIAAGEVVERPANAVKELLENAMDAGAARIAIEIRQGGEELLSVTDDGCGMSGEDLALSVKRHATSKIRTPADLDAIGTLGFRGEALAAISASSRFTIMTKRKEDPFGHQITCEGEKIGEVTECGCADGTTVLVRDLFFNQPARKKFLKRPQTEASAILQYVRLLAVSRPEIAFKFTSDGDVKLQTVGNGKLDDCVYSVYGGEFASSIVPVSREIGNLTVSGFVTRPEKSRNNHSYQSFYVNRRCVKSRTMQFALEDAYKSFVKSEKFPGCVLFLSLPAEEVDVNVHPAKLEVRFRDEKSVYNTVFAAVRGALEKLSNDLARETYFAAVNREEAPRPIREAEPYRPVIQPPRPAREEVSLFAKAKEKIKRVTPPEERVSQPAKIETVRPFVFSEEVPEKPKEREKEPSPQTEPASEPEQLTLPGIGERKKENNPLCEGGALRCVLFNAFLVYETENAVYFIDKHAAHERILYEEMKQKHEDAKNVQMLLEPLTLTLTATESAALAEHLEELQNAGFLLEVFGDETFLCRGIPQHLTALGGGDLTDLLSATARELSLGGRASGAGDKLFDRTLYSMACKAALKAGIPSTEADHLWLIEKLKEMDNVIVCPHGRPILARFTKKQIEDLFLRD
ncbi:MAG: DNA mismatch repair endonuclease MutL [Clostridia bacterium]|nr:DNA mismatch repair endonuclease MutL [Clostridia bacterium]